MPQSSQTATTMNLASLLPEAAGMDVALAGLQIDSRLVHAGDAFLAVLGEHHDGRDYIGSALAAGAVAVIAEAGVSELQRAAAGSLPLLEIEGLAQRVGEIAGQFYGEPSVHMHVVGITGTNGKTTTSRILSQLLRRGFDHCGVIGTLGAVLDNEIGETLNTTPDAISLQRQLAQWREQAVAHAVLEVSSHALLQGRVNGLAFDTAVFTNLTHDHLDYHGDMASYGAAKAQLFRFAGLKTAIFNRDDDYSAQIQAVLHEDLQVYDYSLLDPTASVYARNIRYHDSGLEAELQTPWGVGQLHSPLAGDFNLGNLMAAIIAACAAGLPLASALAWSRELHAVAGRMQYVPNERGLQLVVDYAHTPDALAQVLQALRAHTSGKLICVFGCGGDRDVAKREVMGRIASEGADQVFITSDNPRSEDPLAIIRDVEAGLHSAAVIEPDRAEAIALAVAAARPGDCVLVAGKGHESYQQVGAKRYPFDDVEQLQQAASGGAQT